MDANMYQRSGLFLVHSMIPKVSSLVATFGRPFLSPSVARHPLPVATPDSLDVCGIGGNAACLPRESSTVHPDHDVSADGQLHLLPNTELLHVHDAHVSAHARAQRRLEPRHVEDAPVTRAAALEDPDGSGGAGRRVAALVQNAEPALEVLEQRPEAGVWKGFGVQVVRVLRL